jgi:hypothetical protein
MSGINLDIKKFSFESVIPAIFIRDRSVTVGKGQHFREQIVIKLDENTMKLVH